MDRFLVAVGALAGAGAVALAALRAHVLALRLDPASLEVARDSAVVTGGRPVVLDVDA